MEALEMIAITREICNKANGWFIENPTGRLSTIWRKPDFYFHPYEFGGYYDPPIDKYTKKTCLWTGGNFTMPPKLATFPKEGSRLHYIPPGPNRANLRSETPMGFAYAVYLANRLEIIERRERAFGKLRK